MLQKYDLHFQKPVIISQEDFDAICACQFVEIEDKGLLKFDQKNQVMQLILIQKNLNLFSGIYDYTKKAHVLLLHQQGVCLLFETVTLNTLEQFFGNFLMEKEKPSSFITQNLYSRNL